MEEFFLWRWASSCNWIGAAGSVELHLPEELFLAGEGDDRAAAAGPILGPPSW